MSQPSAEVEDRELVVLAQQGDREAFDQLVKRYQKQVYRAAYALVGNIEDAMDVTQEAFLRAYRAIDRFKPEMPLFPWLYRIARNQGLSSLKRRRRRGFSLSLDHTEEDERPVEVADTCQDPRKESVENELETHLAEALDTLKPEDREILLLRVVQQYSYQHIADLLDIPIGTVMSRLYYARSRLKTKMEKYLD